MKALSEEQKLDDYQFDLQEESEEPRSLVWTKLGPSKGGTSVLCVTYGRGPVVIERGLSSIRKRFGVQIKATVTDQKNIQPRPKANSLCYVINPDNFLFFFLTQRR